MGLNYIDIITTLALNLVQYAHSEHILSCNVTDLNPCPGVHQTCNGTTATCECSQGFVKVGEECEAPEDHSGSTHGATAAVVSIFTIALVVCGLVLVVRKYNLVEYFRQKINLRRNNDVLYEDVMIGNDDPPLTL